MKLRCVKKLVLQKIGCWNLGRNGGLWCWKFQRKWELGSVVVSGCSGGNAGKVSGVEERGRMREVWVRLGDEFGEIWKVFWGLNCSGIKEEGILVSGRRRGGEFGSLRLGIAQGRRRSFLGREECASSVLSYWLY